MQHKLKEQEVIYENKIKHIRCKKRSVAFRLGMTGLLWF